MTLRSDNLVAVTALVKAWTGCVYSNVNLWPFGLFLLFYTIRRQHDPAEFLPVKIHDPFVFVLYSTRRHEAFKVRIFDANFILLLMWDKKRAFSVNKRAGAWQVWRKKEYSISV